MTTSRPLAAAREECMKSIVAIAIVIAATVAVLVSVVILFLSLK